MGLAWGSGWGRRLCNRLFYRFLLHGQRNRLRLSRLWGFFNLGFGLRLRFPRGEGSRSSLWFRRRRGSRRRLGSWSRLGVLLGPCSRWPRRRCRLYLFNKVTGENAFVLGAVCAHVLAAIPVVLVFVRDGDDLADVKVEIVFMRRRVLIDGLDAEQGCHGGRTTGARGEGRSGVSKRAWSSGRACHYHHFLPDPGGLRFVFVEVWFVSWERCSKERFLASGRQVRQSTC